MMGRPLAYGWLIWVVLASGLLYLSPKGMTGLGPFLWVAACVGLDLVSLQVFSSVLLSTKDRQSAWAVLGAIALRVAPWAGIAGALKVFPPALNMWPHVLGWATLPASVLLSEMVTRLFSEKRE